ncbi:spore germination protein [Pseudalkalibacillus sp. Hm43]|uniref:spore germination protein n=1 Tax=Pseudalkalibacillus sp. Hm43 TaxID=3450742 RepID=UPI003F43FAD2
MKRAKRRKHLKEHDSKPVQQNHSILQIHPKLEDNINEMKQSIGNSMDIIVREFLIQENLNGAIIYTKGLTDLQMIQELLESLMLHGDEDKRIQFEDVKKSILTVSQVEEQKEMSQLLTGLLSGDSILFLDGYETALLINTRKWKGRGVSEPITQPVVRGPQEAFTETLITNTALIRRKIRDENLWIENRQIGTRTKTDVAIAYINGVADDAIVEEVRSRLDKIKIDGILEGGYIEEFIQDSTYSPFPTVYNTERPDTVAANLLEGRIAIIVDGTPFVLIVPALFVQFFQASEDYYLRSDFGLIRFLRLLTFFISLLAPSLYIAITTFHQEMLQTSLLISLAAQLEGIPFPAFVEASLMAVTFEILREASIRMPKVIGSAISIVGAIVLGEAAYTAGLVSPAMVIVVSITAIASFVTPAFTMSISIRVLRFILMIFAATFGLYGILIALFGLTLHLCSLRSFGVPYLSPVGPFNMNDQKDVLFRFPWPAMHNRPSFLQQQDQQRQSVGRKEPKR